MVVTELAEVSVAYFLGEVIAMAIIPIVGLIMLVVGVRQQTRARRPPPGYPTPGPYPYGVPPGPLTPPTPPQYYPSPSPAPRASQESIALIVVGSLLLGGSLLGMISGA